VKNKSMLNWTNFKNAHKEAKEILVIVRADAAESNSEINAQQFAEFVAKTYTPI
jgi:hypothetical protein